MNKGNIFSKNILVLLFIFISLFLFQGFNESFVSAVDCTCQVDPQALCAYGEICAGASSGVSCTGTDLTDADGLHVNGNGLCFEDTGITCDPSSPCCNAAGTAYSSVGTYCYGDYLDARLDNYRTYCRNDDTNEREYVESRCGWILMRDEEFGVCTGTSETCDDSIWDREENIDYTSGPCIPGTSNIEFCDGCEGVGDDDFGFYGFYDFYNQGLVTEMECVEVDSSAYCLVGNSYTDYCRSDEEVIEEYCTMGWVDVEGGEIWTLDNYQEPFNCEYGCTNGECRNCIDEDKDGFVAVGSDAGCPEPDGIELRDCVDTDETINPYTTEVCNNFDDDCDGLVDDSVANCYCDQGSEAPLTGLPVENCYDGIDNDCDTLIDREDSEDCFCGKTFACDEVGEICHDGACVQGNVYNNYFYDDECGNPDEEGVHADNIHSWGKICRVDDQSGSSLFEYDLAGRITKEYKQFNYNNLLVNPGFEYVSEYNNLAVAWFKKEYPAATVSLSYEDSIGQTMRIQQAGGGDRNWVALKQKINNLNLKPGDELFLSFKYKGTIAETNASQYACFAIGWCSQYNSGTGEYNNPGQTEQWGNFKLTFESITPNTYDVWTQYSDSAIVTEEMLTSCVASNRKTSNCLEWLSIGSMADTAGGTDFQIDDVYLGKVPGEFTENTVVTTYEYDNMNNILRVIDPGGRSLTYDYSILNQPTSVYVNDLLFNPSFESGLNYWEKQYEGSGDSFTTTTSLSKDGNSAALISVESMDAAYSGIKSNVFPLKPNSVYTYSLWFYIPGDIPVVGSWSLTNHVRGCGTNFCIADGSTGITITDSDPKDEWFRRSYSFITNSKADSGQVFFVTGTVNSMGVIYVDAAKLENYYEATDFHSINVDYNPTNTFNSITYDHSVTTDFTYYDRGWVESIITTSPQGQVFNEDYEYDAEGNLKKIFDRTIGGRYVDFVYDVVDRLITANPFGANPYYSQAFDYAYDKAGNILEKNSDNYQYHPVSNKLRNDGVTYYNYDGSGNVITKSTKNLLANPDFENIKINKTPIGWEKRIVNHNLIDDYGFETGTGDWIKYAPENFEDMDYSLASEHHSGERSLFLDVQISASSDTGVTLDDDSLILVEGSTEYIFSAWMKTNTISGADSSATMTVNCYNSNGAIVNTFTDLLSQNSDWTLKELDISTDSDAVYCKPEVYFNNEVGSLFIDDVQFVKGTTILGSYNEADLETIKFDVVSTNSVNGDSSLKINSSNSISNIVDVGLEQIVTVDPSTTYTLSGYTDLNNVDNQAAKIIIYELKDGKRILPAKTFEIIEDNFNRFEFTFPTPTSSLTNEIELILVLKPRTNNVDSEIFFDSLQLEEGSSATTFDAGTSFYFNPLNYLSGIDLDADGYEDVNYVYDYAGRLVERITSSDHTIYFYDQNGELLFETFSSFLDLGEDIPCATADFDNAKNLVFKANGQIVAMLDINGIMKLKGDIKDLNVDQPTGKSFKITNSAGNTVAAIDEDGHLYLLGTLNEGVDSIQPSIESKELIITHSDGDVAMFTESGDLNIKGCVGIRRSFS